jgi:hypothetical protein
MHFILSPGFPGLERLPTASSLFLRQRALSPMPFQPSSENPVPGALRVQALELLRDGDVPPQHHRRKASPPVDHHARNAALPGRKIDTLPPTDPLAGEPYAYDKALAVIRAEWSRARDKVRTFPGLHCRPRSARGSKFTEGGLTFLTTDNSVRAMRPSWTISVTPTSPKAIFAASCSRKAEAAKTSSLRFIILSFPSVARHAGILPRQGA